MDTKIKVRNDPSSGRYEAMAGDRVIGELAYERQGSRATFWHTSVDPEFQGHGVGEAVVRAALDDLVANGMTLTSYCSFVTEFIADNPGYATLLDPA